MALKSHLQILYMLLTGRACSIKFMYSGFDWISQNIKETVPDVLTTFTVVIFRVKLRCITSVNGIILWFLGSYTRVFIAFDQLIRRTKKTLCVTHHQFHHRSGWPFVIFLNKKNAPNKGTNMCPAKESDQHIYFS